MASSIKYLKVKKDNDENVIYPIGANAENIEFGRYALSDLIGDINYEGYGNIGKQLEDLRKKSEGSGGGSGFNVIARMPIGGTVINKLFCTATIQEVS